MYVYFKKSWGKLLFALIIVWLVITIYFYFQHQVTVQVMKVPGWSLDNEENQGVLIKEIRVCDWESGETVYWERWRPVLEFTNKLPTNLQIKYYTIVSRLLHFYTDPYQKLEDGAQNVMVIGMFLISEQDELKLKDGRYYPKIRVYSDDKQVVGISSGFTRQHSGDSNYYLFNAHSDRVYTPIKEETIKITWQWDEGPLVSKSISNSRFESKTYNLFNRPPLQFSNLEPDRQAYEFITAYKDGQKETAQDMIISSHVKGFPWQQIDWVKGKKEFELPGCANYYGEYMGIKNTFTVDLTSKDMKPNENTIKQKIFLVEESGQWKVIDIENVSSL